MTNLRLLVVEDEPDSAAVVEMILTPAGIETVWVETAHAGLDVLGQQPNGFSGVLIDLALPGMDGFGLLNAIRGEASVAHLPCVAITAFHTPELKAKAIKAGFDAYFPKPIDTAIFVQTLERLLH